MSAHSTVLDVELDGRVERYVVRTYDGDDVPDDPDRAIEREFALLQRLAELEIPAPRPMFCDVSHTLLATPFLVVSYVEGVTHVGSDDPETMATSLGDVLADIHRRAPASALADLGLDPRLDEIAGMLSSPPDVLDESTLEPLVREQLHAHWPPRILNGPRLLHGDYWPGNVVWQGGRVVAVLDWEAASIGDPLADLGSARLDVLWFLGERACDVFTDRYVAATGVDTAALPLWDLVAALRPAGDLSHWAGGLPALGRDDVTPAEMRSKLVAFAERALAAL